MFKKLVRASFSQSKRDKNTCKNKRGGKTYIYSCTSFHTHHVQRRTKLEIKAIPFFYSYMFPVQPTLFLIVNLILYLDFWASLSHFLVKCKHRGWENHCNIIHDSCKSEGEFNSFPPLLHKYLHEPASFRRDKFSFFSLFLILTTFNPSLNSNVSHSLSLSLSFSFSSFLFYSSSPKNKKRVSINGMSDENKRKTRKWLSAVTLTS